MMPKYKVSSKMGSEMVMKDIDRKLYRHLIVRKLYMDRLFRATSI